VTDLTLDQWRRLRGHAFVAALLAARWHPQPNDLIGGHCVMPVPQPPSSGFPDAADFCSELVAVHIAELHNAALAARERAVEPEMLRWCGWPGCFSSYNAATGPTTPGWKRVTSPDVALCGPHAKLGHFPKLVTIPGDSPYAVVPTCTCGEQGRPGLFNQGQIRNWWAGHVEQVPA